MKNRTLTVLGAVALATGTIALCSRNSQADEKTNFKMLVPASALADLIREDTKVVNDALKSDNPKKPDLKRAKVSAMMLAVYAEAAADGKDKAKMAALHAQAATVLEDLMKEDGLADAKKDAAKLPSSPAGATPASFDVLKVLYDPENKDYDKDLAMQLFKSTRAGGLGYEKKIKDFAEKNPTTKDMLDIAVMAYKAAMIAQVVERIGPTKAGDAKKTPEKWQKFAKDLQASAVETGDAASKKNAAAVKAALGKMDKSCVNCHEVFK